MFEKFTDPRRSIARDDRAVSEVIGAILIFGLLILLLVLIQANAVPAANKQVELEHNQRVTQDFQTLQEGLYRAAATGSDIAVTMETGVSYPPRFFLLNPGPAIGSLRTAQIPPDTGTEVAIRNAQANGETGDFWNGVDPVEYATRNIEYTPNYNELPNTGTLTWEHSTLFTRFSETNLLFEDATSFIDGRTIRLTLIDGQLSRGAISTSVEMAPISARQRSVTVSESGDPIQIELQTSIPHEEWVEILDGDGGPDPEPFATVLPDTDGDDVVTIELTPGETYELSVSKVRVGTSIAPQTEPHYITTVSGDGTSFIEGQSQRLTVEVRDRYNNPVSGVDISAVTGNELSGDAVTVVGDSTTDENGQVTLEYTTGSIPASNANPQPTVTASFDDGDTELEKATFTFDVTELDSLNLDSSGDVVSGINPEDLSLVSVTQPTGPGTTNKMFDVTFEYTGTAALTIEEMRLLFYQTNDAAAGTYIDLLRITVDGAVTTDNSGQLGVYGSFVDTPDIQLTGGETVTLRFESSKTSLGSDFLGLSFGLNGGDRLNYFFAIS